MGPIQWVAMQFLPSLILILVRNILGAIDHLFGISRTIKWFKRRGVQKKLESYAKRNKQKNMERSIEEIDNELTFKDELLVDCAPIDSEEIQGQGLIGTDANNALYIYVPSKWSMFFIADGKKHYTDEFCYKVTFNKTNGREVAKLRIQEKKTKQISTYNFTDPIDHKKKARGVHHSMSIYRSRNLF